LHYVTADNYTFLYGNGNDNVNLGPDFFKHRRMRSAGKRIEFVKVAGVWSWPLASI